MAKIGSVEVSEKMIQDALAARAEGTGYTGAGDNLIDFGSASSFVDEDSSAKRFSLKITNKSEADELVQLNEIIAAIDGASVIKEGEIKANLTAKGSPRSIELLKNYIGENPTRLRSIKLNVDNVEQLDQPLRYITETPFKTGVEEERIPSNYQSQDTNNPLMTEVSDVKDWVLSRFSTVAFKVGAGRTVNLSILFGAGIDLKKALDNKADEAAQTVAAAYVRSKK